MGVAQQIAARIPPIAPVVIRARSFIQASQVLVANGYPALAVRPSTRYEVAGRVAPKDLHGHDARSLDYVARRYRRAGVPAGRPWRRLRGASPGVPDSYETRAHPGRLLRLLYPPRGRVSGFGAGQNRPQRSRAGHQLPPDQPGFGPSPDRRKMIPPPV